MSRSLVKLGKVAIALPILGVLLAGTTVGWWLHCKSGDAFDAVYRWAGFDPMTGERL